MPMDKTVETPFGRYTLSDDPGRLDVGVVHDYLQRSYWADAIPWHIVERAVSASLCPGAYEGAGRQVGLRAAGVRLCDTARIRRTRLRETADCRHLRALSRRPGRSVHGRLTGRQTTGQDGEAESNGYEAPDPGRGRAELLIGHTENLVPAYQLYAGSGCASSSGGC